MLRLRDGRAMTFFVSDWARKGWARIRRQPRRYLRDRRGNVSVMVALMIIPLVGMLSLAGQISSWYTIDRSLQNAADSAAVAAAKNGVLTNDPGGVPGYRREASAVASQYGLVNSSSVSVASNHLTTCPDGSSSCYQVTITKTVPTLLTGVLGFNGNGTLNGGNAQIISATAIASAAGVSAQFCIVTLGLAGISQPFIINGGPNTDLNGCSTISNGNADCHGQPIGNIGKSYAVGNTNDCAPNGSNVQIKNSVSNPYPWTEPTNTCPNPNVSTSYPQEPNKGFTAPSSNLLSGSYSGTVVVCGDAELNGNVTLTAGTVLVIENGMLDTQGPKSGGGARPTYNLTANGATIVFTGPTISGFSPSHFPTGGGTLTLTAPTSGPWNNVVIYQSPNLPTGSGVDMTAAGSSPTLVVNGVIVAPESNVTISGAINKNVADCMGLVVGALTINGTGSIANDAACGPISVPGVGGSANIALIQ
jgi:hypothetical protein